MYSYISQRIRWWRGKDSTAPAAPSAASSTAPPASEVGIQGSGMSLASGGSWYKSTFFTSTKANTDAEYVGIQGVDSKESPKDIQPLAYVPAAPSLNAVADREESKSLTAAEEGEAPSPPKRGGLLRFFQGGRPSKSATREGGASETPKDGTEKSKNSKNISARAPSQDTKRAVTLQVTRPADTDAASADIDAAASISVSSSTKRAVKLQVTRPADTDAASADIDEAASISVLSSNATEEAALSTLEQALNVITSRKYSRYLLC